MLSRDLVMSVKVFKIPESSTKKEAEGSDDSVTETEVEGHEKAKWLIFF